MSVRKSSLVQKLEVVFVEGLGKAMKRSSVLLHLVVACVGKGIGAQGLRCHEVSSSPEPLNI